MSLKMTGKLALALASAAGVCAAAAAASAGTYTLITPYGGNTTTSVLGINDAGWMTGSVDNTGTGTANTIDSASGFLRDPSGTYTLFSVDYSTVGRAINSSNTVTGYATDNVGDLIPDTEFSRSSGGTVTVLQNPNTATGLSGIAQGVNDSGVIVGDYYYQSGGKYFRHGYVLDGSTFTDLSAAGSLNSDRTSARGVDNAGMVVGFDSSLGTNPTGFTWTSGSGFSTLDDPNGVGGTYLEGISANGDWISGEWVDGSGNFHAFVYDAMNGRFTDLAPPTGTQYDAFGVNDLGQVVLTEADGVASDNWLYTPGVPEPSTWAMLMLGFGMLGLVARRRGRALAAA